MTRIARHLGVTDNDLRGHPEKPGSGPCGLGVHSIWRDGMTDLRGALEDIRDHGYQPSYNGRPSCPFCGNFVDEEETHSPDCELVAALAATEAPEPRRRHDPTDHDCRGGAPGDRFPF